MKNIPKAGLLIVTLVIPALIFLFLNFFGRNHYVLPYLNPATNSSGDVLVQNGDTIFQKVTEMCPGLEGDRIEGKITVLSNLPAECNDSCELVISGLHRVIDLRDNISNLELTTFSGLSSHKTIFNKAGWRRIEFEDDQIDKCFSCQSSFEKGGSIALYKRLLLIDQEGYFRGKYDGSKTEEIDRLMAEVKILDYESKND